MMYTLMSWKFREGKRVGLGRLVVGDENDACYTPHDNNACKKHCWFGWIHNCCHHSNLVHPGLVPFVFVIMQNRLQCNWFQALHADLQNAHGLQTGLSHRRDEVKPVRQPMEGSHSCVCTFTSWQARSCSFCLSLAHPHWRSHDLIWGGRGGGRLQRGGRLVVQHWSMQHWRSEVTFRDCIMNEVWHCSSRTPCSTCNPITSLLKSINALLGQANLTCAQAQSHRWPLVQFRESVP